jgi:hypothetical protein
MTKPTKRNIVRLYTNDERTIPTFSYWHNSTRIIEIPMILAKRFVFRCKRGSPWECLLAEAIKELSKLRPDAFPHKVLFVYVIGTVLYIVTHIPRRPDAKYHSIRYQHNFTGRLRRFDTYSRRQFMREFGDESVVVRIGPPRVHGKPGYRGLRITGDRSRMVLRGAQRRAHDAGIAPRA